MHTLDTETGNNEGEMSLPGALRTIFNSTSKHSKSELRNAGAIAVSAKPNVSSKTQLVVALERVAASWSTFDAASTLLQSGSIARFICNCAVNAQSSKDLKLAVEFWIWSFIHFPAAVLHEFCTILNEDGHGVEFRKHALEMLRRVLKQTIGEHNIASSDGSKHSIELCTNIPKSFGPILRHIGCAKLATHSNDCFLQALLSFVSLLRTQLLQQQTSEPEIEDKQHNESALEHGQIQTLIQTTLWNVKTYVDQLCASRFQEEHYKLAVVGLNDLISDLNTTLYGEDPSYMNNSDDKCSQPPPGMNIPAYRSALNMLSVCVPILSSPSSKSKTSSLVQHSSFLEWIAQLETLCQEYMVCNELSERNVIGTVSRLPMRCVLLSFGTLSAAAKDALIKQHGVQLVPALISILRIHHLPTNYLVVAMLRPLLIELFRTSTDLNPSLIVSELLALLTDCQDSVANAISEVLADLVMVDRNQRTLSLVLKFIQVGNGDKTSLEVKLAVAACLVERVSLSWIDPDTSNEMEILQMSQQLCDVLVQWLQVDDVKLRNATSKLFCAFDPRIVIPKLVRHGYQANSSATSRSNTHATIVDILVVPFGNKFTDQIPVGLQWVRDNKHSSSFQLGKLTENQIYNWQQLVIEVWTDTLVGNIDTTASSTPVVILHPGMIQPVVTCSRSISEEPKNVISECMLDSVGRWIRAMEDNNWPLVLELLLIKYWANTESSTMVQLLRRLTEPLSNHFGKIVLPIVIDKMMVNKHVMTKCIDPKSTLESKQLSLFARLAPLLVLKVVSPDAMAAAKDQVPELYVVLLQHIFEEFCRDDQVKEVQKLAAEVFARVGCNITVSDLLLGSTNSFGALDDAAIPVAIATWLFESTLYGKVNDSIPVLMQLSLNQSYNSNTQYWWNVSNESVVETSESFWGNTIFALNSGRETECLKVLLYMLFNYLLLARHHHDSNEHHPLTKCALSLPKQLVDLITCLLEEVTANGSDMSNTQRGCSDCITVILGGCPMQQYLADIGKERMRSTQKVLVEHLTETSTQRNEITDCKDWITPINLYKYLRHTILEDSERTAPSLKTQYCNIFTQVLRSASSQANLDNALTKHSGSESVVYGILGFASSFIPNITTVLSQCTIDPKRGSSKVQPSVFHAAMLQLLFTSCFMTNLGERKLVKDDQHVVVLETIQVQDLLRVLLSVLGDQRPEMDRMRVGSLKVIGAILSFPVSVLAAYLDDKLVGSLRIALQMLRNIDSSLEVQQLAESLGSVLDQPKV